MGRCRDFAISADGRIAYRRVPHSPAGFAALTLVSEFTEDKPVFARLLYDHRSTDDYIVDPAGVYTASSDRIYARLLDRHVATLTFSPSCFFTTRPLIVGLDDDKLAIASYNTFKSIERRLTLPERLKEARSVQSRRLAALNLRIYTGNPARVLADDVNGRVIYAAGDKVATVSLAELGLPEEPFVTLKPVTSELVVGQASVLACSVQIDLVTTVRTPD